MTSLLLLARVDFYHYLFAIPMALLSIFLTLVILVQRGRGGGLTGALGGMGGQSAFGTKAGDLFTRITIVVAALWVLLSMASIKVLAQRQVLNPNLKQAPTAPLGKTGITPPVTSPPVTSPPATSPLEKSTAPGTPSATPAPPSATPPATTAPLTPPAEAAPATAPPAKSQS